MTIDEADKLFEKHTGYTFLAFCDANSHPNQRPTFSVNLADAEERKVLADLYDEEMIRRGLPNRAWRGSGQG